MDKFRRKFLIDIKHQLKNSKPVSFKKEYETKAHK